MFVDVFGRGEAHVMNDPNEAGLSDVTSADVSLERTGTALCRFHKTQRVDS